MTLSRFQARDAVFGILIVRAEASSFGVVLIEQETDPASPPAIFITSVSEPADMSHFTLLAKHKQSTLWTTGYWKNATGRKICCSAERHRFVATWIHKIRIGFVQPEMVSKDDPQTDVVMPDSSVYSGSSFTSIVSAIISSHVKI
jgi:hypothetical protein